MVFQLPVTFHMLNKVGRGSYILKCKAGDFPGGLVV